MLYSDATSEAIAVRCEGIYHQYREELESQYKGQFFVVDIETENYEIAETGELPIATKGYQKYRLSAR